MRKTVKYWSWDETLNSSPFKLGEDINNLIAKNVVKKSKERFIVENKNISSIDVVNEKVRAVFFNDNIEFFNPKNLWDFEEEEFVKEMNSKLSPATIETKGDVLLVSFRGGFVSYLGIIRKL